MKKRILSLIIVGMISAVAFTSMAQVRQKDKDATGSEEENDVNTAKKTPVKIIEYIPGKWVIEGVYKGKEDISKTDTVSKNETIEFNREGRYVSYSGSEKIDSGAYRINEQHAILYLASESDNDRSSQWNVWFDKTGTMTLKTKGTDAKEESLRYVYRKEDSASSSNRE
jgi:hypothetical protein